MRHHGYLAMELIPGRSRSQVLDERSQPLAEQDVLSYAEQLASALDFLHTRDKPVIQCDIKPDNIRLTPEARVKLVDFGLSKQLIETSSMSCGGFTPAYATPEHWMRPYHRSAHGYLLSGGNTLSPADGPDPDQLEDAHRTRHSPQSAYRLQ